MNSVTSPRFGHVWFDALNTSTHESTGSLLTGTTHLDGQEAHLAAVVPDPDSRFPRARTGEVGVGEGLELGRWIRSLDDDGQPLVLIIDVPSQAYGYVEELLGIHVALASSADAVARTRLNGRPVVAFVVGKAISGAFLATGLQANRIVSLQHPGVQVQVMSKQAAARITQRTVEDLDRLAETIPAMAFDIDSFSGLGAVDTLVTVSDPAAPAQEDLDSSRAALAAAIADVRRTKDVGLAGQLRSEPAQESRVLSRQVREKIDAHW